MRNTFTARLLAGANCTQLKPTQLLTFAICRLKLQSSQNKLAAPQYRKGDSHRQMMNVSHSKMGC